VNAVSLPNEDYAEGAVVERRHDAEKDFQVPVLAGHGDTDYARYMRNRRPALSGFESPGWRGVQAVSTQLKEAFDELSLREEVNLVELYRSCPEAPLYRLCEAMIEWDERVALWRTRHYKVATRIIGHDVVGTKGTPVDVLTRLLANKFFPELWNARTEITRIGPMGVSAGGVR
jgi:hypothetical protein